MVCEACTIHFFPRSGSIPTGTTTGHRGAPSPVRGRRYQARIAQAEPEVLAVVGSFEEPTTDAKGSRWSTAPARDSRRPATAASKVHFRQHCLTAWGNRGELFDPGGGQITQID